MSPFFTTHEFFNQNGLGIWSLSLTPVREGKILDGHKEVIVSMRNSEGVRVVVTRSCAAGNLYSLSSMC